MAKSNLTTERGPFQVVCLAPVSQNGSRTMQPRRRRVKSPYGGAEYSITLQPYQPHLLVGQGEIDAVAPLVTAGQVNVLRIDPEHLEHIAQEALQEATIAEFTKLKDELTHLRSQLPEHQPTVIDEG